MAMPVRQLSLEQFLRLPEEEPPLEFEEAEATQKVSPKGKHSRLQWMIGRFLDDYARPRKLAMVFPELRVTFAGRSYVPDISVYRWERVPVDESGQIANDFCDPPDIAVEIASPEQSVNALVRRCLWYVANGVQIALLVDAADASVLQFRPDRVPKAIRGSERIDLDDLLPGFDLAVGELLDSLHAR